MVWDLRHPPPPFSGNGASDALPVPPHPLTPRGPFVAPGRYTVTLAAGDVRRSQPVDVEGDPALPIGESEWYARERFLVDLLRLQRRVWDREREAEQLRERLTARRDSLAEDEAVPADLAAVLDSARAVERRLTGLRFRVYGLAGEFNGRGVRQGTLYPPTETQRRRRDTLEEALNDALAALARVRTEVAVPREE